MIKQQRSEVESTRATEVGADLQFDGALAVRGIVYHLLEENLARAIDPETITRTIDRLQGKPFQSHVERGRWAVMTNPQRLQWLLNETQTVTLVGEDEKVYLRSRRGK